MKLVMFDIDGTLTQTDRADETCFVQALREVFGFSDVNTDWASYPHCSDSGILEDLFQSRAGRSPLPAEVSAFQAHFLSLLAGATAVQTFSPIPGARDFLCSLIEDPAFAVCLASGAWEGSARFKLASAGFVLQQIPAAHLIPSYTSAMECGTHAHLATLAFHSLVFPMNPPRLRGFTPREHVTSSTIILTQTLL